MAFRAFGADLDRRNGFPDHSQPDHFSSPLIRTAIFYRLNALQHFHRLTINAKGQHHTIPTLKRTFEHGAVIVLHRIKHALVKGGFLTPIGMGDANSERHLHGDGPQLAKTLISLLEESAAEATNSRWA